MRGYIREDSANLFEEPCAGKSQARFCGGWHDSKTLNLINKEE